MKTTEEYIEKYKSRINEFSRKGEPWRVRISLQEFVQEIEGIRNYESEQKKNGYFTPYHIENSVSNMISILLIGKVTLEEMKEQLKRHKGEIDKQFERDAPRLRESIKGIKTPLTFSDVTKLYSGLLRNQISLEMIEGNVLEEFKKTRQYQRIIRRKNNHR